MPINYANKRYLTVPEQVQKNKDDIKALQDAPALVDIPGNAATATLAATITVADTAAEVAVYPVFSDSATGPVALKTDTSLSYVPSTGVLTAVGASFTDLTVTGTLLTKNAQEVNIGDAVIKLNAEETGTASENAGIEVERGTGTNTSIL